MRHGATLHRLEARPGMPLRIAVPDSGSSSQLVGRARWSSSPACSPATPRSRARLVVAPAVRDRDDAGHDVVGHLDRDLDRARARAHAAGLAVDQPEALGVVGVDVGGAALWPADEHRQVVHPRVVGAQVAAADEDHAAVDRARPAPRAGARRRRRAARARARSCRSAVRSTSGSARLQRAEVDAVRRGLEVGERQPVGPAAQQQVEQPLGPDAAARARPGARRGRGRGRASARRRSARRAVSSATKLVDRRDVGVRPLAGDDRR